MICAVVEKAKTTYYNRGVKWQMGIQKDYGVGERLYKSTYKLKKHCSNCSLYEEVLKRL